MIWQHSSDVPAEVSICISSYNYAKRIPAALESCRAQSLQAVELVIVDDASTELASSFQAAFAKSSNSEIITAVTAGGALLALVATVAFKAGRRDRHASYQPVNDYPLA